MGGRSTGFVTVEEGTLRFTGTLVTQGDGFTSVRARRVVDLAHIGGVGIYMADGQDGPFRLQADYIRTYGPGEEWRAA